MEYRKIFDTIPEQFDKFRPRYSAELFADLIAYAGIGPDKTVLELGPGTGQATEPILKTGCDYHAIELGENFYAKMKEHFDSYPNFHIVNDDFITHDFGEQKYDVIYSAATIQWIPERIAFPKTLSLLKPGGVLAMMLTNGDYKSPNEDLYNKIQKVYDEYYKPEKLYKDMKEPFDYRHATDYGYVDFERRDFYGKRIFNADEYVSYCGTHSDHLAIPEPLRTKFFEMLRKTVADNGNRVEFRDTYILFLTRKPL
ncbi:MAG: methyltransferase [Lachnospiraceae bacterium]|nr:methyltransferase [Lachnospiraceae bacterium]